MVGMTEAAVLSLQVAILGLLAIAVRRRNVAAAVNALSVLLLSLLPRFVEVAMPALVDRSITVDPLLSLWIAIAGVLHALGMLGLYETTWWWDHLTHTLSAALVAAFLYASLIVSFPGFGGPVRQSLPALIVTVVLTLAIGVFWELIELVARAVAERFDIDPVLVHYGWRDTAADLVFDTVGAVLVVAADLQLFFPLVERVPELTRTVMIAGGWFVLAGSVSMALVLWAGPPRGG